MKLGQSFTESSHKRLGRHGLVAAMEQATFSHSAVWEEVFARTRDSLQGIADYLGKVRSGTGAQEDPDFEWYGQFDLDGCPRHEADAALDYANGIVFQLEAQLAQASPTEARDAIVSIMRDNMEAHLFEGIDQTSYRLGNDVIETLALHYKKVCEERRIPGRTFLLKIIFEPAERYAEIASNTIDSIAGRVRCNLRDEGIDDENITTPYEYALHHVLSGGAIAANDVEPTTEQEIAAQREARRLLDGTVRAFHDVPPEQICPEMVWMVETLAEYRAGHNAPYRDPESTQNIVEASARDFAKIYRACPAMAEDVAQLFEAVGRTDHAIGRSTHHERAH